MTGASYPEAVAGLLLVFFVPGYAVVKATFPEWRIRGPEAYLRLVETVTLAFVLSVVLTVLLGTVLLLTPAGVQVYWTDPVLEATLAGVAIVAGVAGWLRGAYRKQPPLTATPPGDGEEGAWELTRELEAIIRAERRVQHALRVAEPRSTEASRLEAELSELRNRREELRREREAEYAA